MRSAISSRRQRGRLGHRFAERLLEPLDQLAFDRGEQVRRARLQLVGDRLDLGAVASSASRRAAPSRWRRRGHAVERFGQRLGAWRLAAPRDRCRASRRRRASSSTSAVDRPWTPGMDCSTWAARPVNCPRAAAFSVGSAAADAAHDVDPAFDLAAAQACRRWFRAASARARAVRRAGAAIRSRKRELTERRSSVSWPSAVGRAALAKPVMLATGFIGVREKVERGVIEVFSRLIACSDRRGLLAGRLESPDTLERP